MIESNLHIITYNMHKGFNFRNTRYVLENIRTAILQVNPDLVFLQEVQGEGSRRPSPLKPTELANIPQYEYLAKGHYPYLCYGKNAIYPSGHHGNAMLSKYEIMHSENINVTPRNFASRSILHSIIKIPGISKPVHTLCIHLGLTEVKRNEQINILCQRIQSLIPNDEPLVIAGDFNDWRGNAEASLEQNLDLKEVFKVQSEDYAKTFPAWHPTLRMDRIYYRCLELKIGKCINAEPWTKLSDHLPLYAEFFITSG